MTVLCNTLGIFIIWCTEVCSLQWRELNKTEMKYEKCIYWQALVCAICTIIENSRAKRTMLYGLCVEMAPSVLVPFAQGVVMIFFCQ